MKLTYHEVDGGTKEIVHVAPMRTWELVHAISADGERTTLMKERIHCENPGDEDGTLLHIEGQYRHKAWVECQTNDGDERFRAAERASRELYSTINKLIASRVPVRLM